jgi:hypothetical protein
LTERDEVLAELLRNKKSAESNFKKVRLAYEGPKQSTKVKSKRDSTGDSNNPNDGSDEKAPFVPTATKKEYVSVPIDYFPTTGT